MRVNTFMNATLTVCCAAAVLCSGATAAEYLPGQVRIDPENPAWLVYNRDANRDGKLDPAFLVGPGDPEGFLFLGERQADGTRAGGRQQQIIERLAKLGGNAIYFQAVRSHGGDGEDDHNPWRNPRDSGSGLNPSIIRQWQGWFDALREAGVVVLFFVYDDGAHPFDDGCQEAIGEEEAAFIRDLVNAFEEYPNLVWVVQEEFKFVGHSGKRRPCDAARLKKVGEIASLIERHDDHDHPVGVHHNIGDAMAFPDHPAVDVYVQQADVRPAAGHGNLEALHAAGQPGHGFDAQRRYSYIMGEGYDWHPKLVAAGDRAMLRKTYYATATAGGYMLVLGMFPTEEGAEPTDAMLEDMRRVQQFFESIPVNTMAPHDELAAGDTDWVLAAPDHGRYVLYSHDGGEQLGIRGLKPGQYRLRWFDPVDGDDAIVETTVGADGPARFVKPKAIGAEAVVYVERL
ncbi:MAG: hypothetical protein ACOY3P_20880 [Planctomycetota bacterium]